MHSCPAQNPGFGFQSPNPFSILCSRNPGPQSFIYLRQQFEHKRFQLLFSSSFLIPCYCVNDFCFSLAGHLLDRGIKFLFSPVLLLNYFVYNVFRN